MKTIFKRYQYYNASGLVWTDWFKVKDVSEENLQKTVSQLENDINFVIRKTHLLQEIDVRNCEN